MMCLILHPALAQAAITARTDAEVLEAVHVALPGGKLLVPDIVVVAAGAAGETTTRPPPEQPRRRLPGQEGEHDTASRSRLR
jgi:hypothetical protein